MTILPLHIAERALRGLCCAAIFAMLVTSAPCLRAETGSAAQQAARLNNVGTALMNQQLLDRAEQKFAEAYAKDPKLGIARLNQGLALLYLQKLSKAEAALKQAAAQVPRDPHPPYALGLLYRSENRLGQAADAFRQVLALDPSNADAHYFLGSFALDLQQFPPAASEFQAALETNPLHASAEFGLARAFQREGRTEQARAAFERFQHITHDKLDSPLTHNYGEEGAYGRVEDAADTRAQAGPMIPVSFTPTWQGADPASADSINVGKAPGTPAAARGCLIQLHGADSDEPATLVVPGGGIYPARLYRNISSRGAPAFKELSAEKAGIQAGGRGVACAVGDYDNDGLPDLALATADRLLLYRNLGNGSLAEVSKEAGLRPRTRVAGLTFVDYDHDGDIDLLVTGTGIDGGPPNILYRNNGDKTFTDWTAETGLGGVAGAPTASAIPTDANNDRAIDLVVAGAGAGARAVPTIYTNPREGRFAALPLFTRTDLAPVTSFAMLDFNKDGWMDALVSHAGAPGVSLWRNIDGRRFERAALPAGLQAQTVASVVPIDFDNDGWIDLVFLETTPHGSRLRALRNLGPDGFRDVSADLGLDRFALGASNTLLASDVDRDGAADLIMTDASGAVRVLHNNGGNRNHSLRIALKGVADNRSAIGTKVEVFSDGLWQKWEVTGEPEILAGTGPALTTDLVRLLWPTGVPQDELDISTAKPLLLTETDRRGSSCPTLFAWNGKKYDFVADVIGAGVVGHWVSPTARNTPDPDEWIKVDGAKLTARDGFFSLRFGEPMEEVNYVDQVRLFAVDHPAGTAVNPHEGFLSERPFAPGELVLSRHAHPPTGAWNDHGHDVLPLLRKSDHRYVRDFTNIAYAGFANQHTLTLDLGPDAAFRDRSLRLLLHGFVEYFSASSMYAASQAGFASMPPYVEAQLPNGTWHRIIDDMGFPAGLPRTVVVELTGKLPPSSTRIRIVSNLQIYWDQALVDTTPSASAGAVRSTELPLSRANLAFRGYPRQLDGKTPGDLTYNYSLISQTGPFLPQRGGYTRYGDVTPLLGRIDDEFVVFGTGEDMDLEFSSAPLPPLAPGWVRDYFFYANGFVKDMDFYEAQPFTVATLPFHAMSTYPYTAAEHYPSDAAHTAYQLEWNTRFESGRAPRAYQFHYVPRREAPETGIPQAPAPGLSQ